MNNKKRISWAKIGSNFIIAFCTAWLGSVALGLGQEALLIAISNAIITGLLAAGVEMQRESNGTIPPVAAKLLVI